MKDEEYDPFAEIDELEKLRRQKPLPCPITPTRYSPRSVMPRSRESLEERLLREARERARVTIALNAADREEQRLIQEGRERLDEPAYTMADKINLILKKHGEKPNGLAKAMGKSDEAGRKSVTRFLNGQSKTPPGPPAAIAKALRQLCSPTITEKDILV